MRQEDLTKKLMTINHLQGTGLLINNYHTTVVSSGFADVKAQIQNGAPNVVYPLASLQKALSAAAIVLLVNTHAINQQTKLNKFFPEISHADQITIRQLMTHLSGLKAPEKTPIGILSEDEAIKWNIKNTEVVSQPGAKFNYTNVNYILLAGIIRQVTQQNYQQFLTDQILKKTGVLNTFFWNSIPANFIKAKSYIYSTKDYQHEYGLDDPLASALLGAGSLYTTPQDYYTMQRALRDGKILNPEDYHYMIETLPKASNKYGGGMYHEKVSGINYKYAFGFLHGNGTQTQHANFANEMYLSEGNKNGVLMFTNQSPNKLKSTDFKSFATQILAQGPIN